MKIFKNLFIIGFVFFMVLLYSSGSEKKLNPAILNQDVLEKIANEVSGRICFEHIRKLTTLHRIWGSKDYSGSAQYFINKSKEYGLKDAIIEKYSIRTGSELFWMHSTGGYVPWDCKGGELRLVKPYSMLITHYESAPSTVAVCSKSTDIEAEVIYVGKGDSKEDYKDKDVKGKIVLSENGRSEKVHELAVHHFGAAGSIHFYNLSGCFKEAEGIYWGRISPWNKDRTKPSTFGFNISTTQGLFLKNLLLKGEKVTISAEIDAEVIKNGYYELATAVIPGSVFGEEEFIFYAHLDHPKPGAHDNASGDAVLLEIARTLSSLIQKGIIPPPKRTIRFMWIPHMSGLNMYLYNHQDKIGKIKAGCNLDCVGVNQARFSSLVFVSLPPYSLPTYLTDITNNLVEYYNLKTKKAIFEGNKKDLLFSPEGSRNLFSILSVPYKGASDEYTANTLSLNIPSIYFFDHPLPPRHNQINFLEYIDSTSLKRVSYLGSIISYTFASIDEEMTPFLINEIYARGMARLHKDLLKAKYLLENANITNLQREFKKGGNLLLWRIKTEKSMLNSVSSLTENKADLKKRLIEQMNIFQKDSKQIINNFQNFYSLKCEELGISPKTALKESKLEHTLKNIIPILNPEIKGSPCYFTTFFEKALGEDFLKKYDVSPSFRYGNVGYYETLNYVDGTNSILDIYKATQAELLSGNYSFRHFLTLEETNKYLVMLKDSGVIFFKHR